jgi:hypothetical protein
MCCDPARSSLENIPFWGLQSWKIEHQGWKPRGFCTGGPAAAGVLRSISR